MISPYSHRLSSFSRRDLLRNGLLALAATPLARSLGQTAPQVPQSAAPELKATSFGGKQTLIAGGGGNIVTLAGDDGALVIDSGLAAVSAGVGSEISKAAPGPLAVLVNTHWHFDHTGGNERLARAGARIVAHENCRKRLSTEQYIEFFKKTIPASPAIALPLITFTDESTLHINGETIRLISVPPAHTDGDIIVHFEQANVVHGGDLFFNGLYPFIDYSSGGWIGGMVSGAKRILEKTDAKTKVVPGHGPLATQDDLKFYVSFLETMLDRLSKLKAEGKTVDEAVAAAPTKEYDEKLGKGMLTPETFVRASYASLLKHAS
jgi:glyoxylase-like metal-dependent hydrolase (beta-lactamase superfamily II)